MKSSPFLILMDLENPPATTARGAKAAAARHRFEKMLMLACITSALLVLGALAFLPPVALVVGSYYPVLPEFSVDSAAVSNLTVSAPSAGLLTAVIDVTLSVTNPNRRVPVAFNGPLKASVLGPAGATLAQAALPPPSWLEGHGSTVLETRLWAGSQYVGERAAGDIAEAIDRSGEVRAMVAARVEVKLESAFRVFLKTGGLQMVKVCCDGVRLRPRDLTAAAAAAAAAGGSMAAPAHCKVKMCHPGTKSSCDCCFHRLLG